ncbi:MAG: circularly permuted type 2 ATP-grasp protein [Methylomicrobium sp.]
MNSAIAKEIGAQHYATQLTGYDEMYAGKGTVLPYWEHFINAIEQLGIDELEHRRREAQRLLRENGVTYNVYNDARSLSRPWKLDPIPLLISSKEWAVIEAGLIQRAELLNLLLKDIYGEQTLLKKGLLPAELVYGHDGFLRPCVGSLSAHQRQLFLYSANLARGPDGRMWVLDDRTQAPSGAGYALENRSVMTRVLPDLFGESHVRRLAGFFRALRSGLTSRSPGSKAEARVVVLTPGPFNETYFEHAYLSSQLGYALVQGDDLTVRDGKVWLKSIQGLQPVDAILRRVDDSFCDPLELRSISRLGVAGLLEAVRRGHVSIVNPLGSSILENNALLAFLPRLARHLLGEELRLPSVATWWCGQRRECHFVLENLGRLVIKQVNRTSGVHAVFGARLTERQKRELRAAILAKPYLYVGQEQVSFSTVPAFIDGHIAPRNAILRTFVVAGEDGYQAMPGGLTRIAPQQDNLVVSNQAGGISKDTWVLAEQPDQPISLWLQSRRDMIVEAVNEPLPSRAADNLYWVGRHLERVEAAARLLRTLLQKWRDAQEYSEFNDALCLKILLRALTHVTVTYPGFTANDESLLADPLPELLSLIQDDERYGTIPAAVQAFVQSAFSIRDLWSQDTWRSIDDIRRCWRVSAFNQPLDIGLVQSKLDDLISAIVAFIGVTGESMTREAGWLMLDSGRRLERCLSLIALLRATVVLKQEEGAQYPLLEAVLTTTDSLSIYQRRYRSFVQLPMVLELLVLDQTHPRSLVFQLNQLFEYVKALPRERGKVRISAEEKQILEAFTKIRLIDIGDLTRTNDESGVYSALDAVLAETAMLLSRASEMIAKSYFSHTDGPYQLNPTQLEEEL